MQKLIWVGSSKKELLVLPKTIVQQFGFALHLAQEGKKHEHAKPLKGFKGAGVLEIVEENEGDAYRAIYTVRFEGFVFVLHCFQKKSKRGISTPRGHMDIVRARLKAAQAIYQKEISNEDTKK